MLLWVLLWVWLRGLGRRGAGCCVRSVNGARFVLFDVSGSSVGALTVVISRGRLRVQAFCPIIPG